MGYIVELNTLLGLPKGFDIHSLRVGKRYKILKARERAFPLHVAILIVDDSWNFYGYGVAHAIIVQKQKTQIEFEVLTLFSPNEQSLYRKKFVEAATTTGEIR